MGLCALVAASEFNAECFRKRCDAGAFDHVIAVDAGYAHLERIGVEPSVALGDFDSLGFVPQGLPVVKHPAHKDQSDMELAFDYAHAQGFDDVEVYGALGGRLDHALANLQVFARFAELGMKVKVVDAQSQMRVLVGPGKFDLPAIEQGTVSVFSAKDEAVGVTERGLEYPLENALLTNRTSLGLSNELTGKAASISVERGTLYVFYPLA